MANKQKHGNWIAGLMRNYRLTSLLIILLFIFGLYGLDQMPKDSFPSFTIRQGVVVAIYPGASAEEVEQQVAKPLERYLFQFKEVRREKTTSTSSNGMCMVMLELNEEVNNKDEVWSKIKHGLNLFKQQLPQGVLALIANDEFGDTSALLIALESESRSYRELHGYVDRLSDELRKINSVSNVRIYGDIKEQLTLYIDHQRLSAYGISTMQLYQKLNANGLILPTGSLSNQQQNVPIHVSGTVNSEEEVGNLVIYTDAQNHVVRVRDVATIRREYDRTESYIEQNGHPSIIVSLEMREGNNIMKYGDTVNRLLDDFRENVLPKDVSITRIADQPKVVGDSVKDFLLNLIESMLVIILVMMVLFPFRTAVVAAVTIPLSTFISVGIMYMLGIPLNTVTLAGLIIVLGMIVDNSIVVLDGYLEYLGKGYSRWHAAAESAQHYFFPMLLATLCICAIFYPFLFIFKGQYREFINGLPLTITINLMVSLLLAVVVIPIMEFALIKPEKTGKSGESGHSGSITRWVQNTYNHALDWTFRHPWLTICGGMAIVTASFFILTQLKFRSMPYADREQFAVEIFLPEGSGLAETKTIADSIYNALKQDERVQYITSFIGCSSPRFQTSYAPQVGGKNFAQFIVATPSVKDMKAVLDKYEPLYTDRYPNALVKFKELDFQNVETFEFRFYGDDIDSLHTVANRLMAFLRQQPELFWVHSDYEQPRLLTEVTLNPTAAAQQGVDRATTAMSIAMLTGNLNVGTIWEKDYEMPIVIKDRQRENLPLSGVGDLPIASKLSGITGNSGISGLSPQATLLRQVADIHPVWSEEKIVRRCGERCISVKAEPRRGVLPSKVESRIEEFIDNDLQIPRGVRSEIGGIVEANGELIPQIMVGMLVASLIIFFFILFNFKRFGITFVCIAAISLAFPGMLLGLWAMNRMLGLTAVFGVVTLMGIIMRNEILIFEHADALVKKGWSVRDAAYDAGKRRMVPIFLTTSTTAVGVIPMIIAGTSFWMPVGVSIFAGGIGALILVVTMLPVVYWKTRSEKRIEKMKK